MKNHILIIDDTPSFTEPIEEALTIQSPTSTVKIVTGYIGAIEYIKEQARETNFPDTIVMDLFIQGENNLASWTFLEELENIVKNRQERRPNHKGDLKFSSPELIIHAALDKKEIYDYAISLDKKVPFEVTGFSKGDKSFVRYLAGNPVKQDIWKYQENAGKVFSHMPLEDAISALWDDNISHERMVRGVDPEEVLALHSPQLNPTEEQSARAISFEAGVGKPMVGKAVFSIDSAQKLVKDGATYPLILIGEQPAQTVIENAPFLDGAVNIMDEPIAHFKEVARGKGLSILSADFQSASTSQFALKETSLHYGGVVINEGEIVSIDPHNGVLYPEAVELKEASFPDGFDILTQIINEECPYSYGNHMNFYPQADTANDTACTRGDPGISKMENYFLHKDSGLSALNTYLFSPTGENLEQVKVFLKEYIQEEIISQTRDGGLHKPVFRLIDFKPDELLLDKGRENELNELYGLDDLRGTALAKALPAFYQMQVQAILEETPSYYTADGGDLGLFYPSIDPCIVVPMTQSIDHYDYMRGIVRRAAEHTWGSEAVQVSVLPMIETQDAIKLVPELIKRIGNTQGTENHCCTSDNTLFVGGSDLMSDIMGGISRADESGIKNWMKENRTDNHPFRTISPAMEEALCDIKSAIKASGEYVNLRFSGVQAHHLDALEKLEHIGINEVTVPAEALYLEGMPMALRLREKQDTNPSTNVLFQEHFRYGRNVEGMEQHMSWVKYALSN